MKITRRFIIICGLLVLSACAALKGEGLAPGKQAAVESQPGVMKTHPAKTLQFIEFYSPL